MTAALSDLVLSGVQEVVVSASAYQGSGATALAVAGGTVNADSRRSIMRDAIVELAPSDALTLEAAYDMLVTPGVTIGLSRGFRLADGTLVTAPLGRFVPDLPELRRDAAGYHLTVAASDLSIRVQRARWTDPYQVGAGSGLADTLTAMLADRYPPITSAITSDVCPDVLSAGMVTEAGDQSDPWADACSLAAAYGYSLLTDVSGTVVVRKVATPTATAPVFTFATGAAAIITESTRSSPLERTYNGVIATGEGTGAASPVRGEAWDENPASPTYRYGGFGKVPYFYSSPLLTTQDQCEAAAATLLAGLLGRAETLSFSCVPHPGLQPLDVVAVQQASGSLTNYVVDALSVPLDLASPMTVSAREIAAAF